MSGWIKVHRRLQKHWIWSDADKLRAWLDLLLLANWETRKVNLGRRLIDVQRGQFIASKRKLSEKWGWSREKADAFFTLLESDHMIVQKSGQSFTMITICNYDEYQDREEENQATDEATNQATDQATPQPLPSTTKNSKKIKEPKEPKNAYGLVMLTNSQKEKLINQLGHDRAKRCVEFLSLHIASKGDTPEDAKRIWRTKFKSDYHCILKWVIAAVDEQESREAKSMERSLGTVGLPTDPMTMARARIAASIAGEK